MKNPGFRVIQLWMLATLLLWTAASGCGRKESTASQQRTPGSQGSAARGSIRLGVVLPLTGPSAIHGKDCLVGMEMARDKVNKDGGIGGRPIEFIVEDDASKPAATVEALKKLIDVDKVPVVIGTISSAGTLAGAEVADRAKVVLFSPTAASPAIHGKSPYCFRIGLMTTPQGKCMADYCYTRRGIKSMAILAMNDETGLAYANDFQQAYEALGGKITPRLEYQKTDTEFRTALTQLKNAGVKDLYVTGVPATMAYIARQATELAYSPNYFANAGIEGEDLLTKAGSAANGIIFTGLAPNDTFLTEFQSRAQRQPGISGPQGYDSVMIIANALRAKGLGREGIRQFLAGMPQYDGVGGEIAFDATGEVLRQPHLKNVVDGDFRRLQIP